MNGTSNIHTKILRFGSAQVVQARVAKTTKRISMNADPNLSDPDNHKKVARELSLNMGFGGPFASAECADGSWIHINLMETQPW